MKLTEDQRMWLERMAMRADGKWPDRPFLRDKDSAIPLMRMGLVEAVQPPAPYLPYVAITDAGRAALNTEQGGRSDER